MMSSQPSTVDSLKDTASSAADTVANMVKPAEPNHDPDKDKANFTKDIHGNTMKKGDYKHQLTEAAMGGPPKKEESAVGKVLSYIPGVDKVQQSMFEQGQSAQRGENKPGPPDRPDHDVQVEQFLRKQYHSRSGDGMPDPNRQD